MVTWKEIRADLEERVGGTLEDHPKYQEAQRRLDIAASIRLARTAAGLTQQELSERMGTSQPHIARLESGGALPQVETLQRVADATGVHFVVRPHSVSVAGTAAS